MRKETLTLYEYYHCSNITFHLCRSLVSEIDKRLRASTPRNMSSSSIKLKAKSYSSTTTPTSRNSRNTMGESDNTSWGPLDAPSPSPYITTRNIHRRGGTSSESNIVSDRVTDIDDATGAVVSKISLLCYLVMLKINYFHTH